eukprot:TRINITY_DN4413_c0_g1_i2.p1 TRINITY_DN4413_c0_g1~~TRINITY_DN4413_c0_g1_i2.p1  ORF type:complete len:503 (-),score=130.78 TRINITY_DN4413_c0_g1_i2:53-1345(-)
MQLIELAKSSKFVNPNLLEATPSLQTPQGLETVIDLLLSLSLKSPELLKSLAAQSSPQFGAGAISIEAIEQHYQALLVRRKQLESRVNQDLARRAESEKRQRNLLDAKSGAESRLKLLQELHSRATAEIQALQAEEEALQARLAAQQKERLEIERVLGSPEYAQARQLREAEIEKDQVNEQVSSYETEMRELADKRREFEHEKDQLLQKKSELESRLAAVLGEASQKSTVAESARQRLDQLKSQLAQLSAQLSVELKNKEQAHARLRSELRARELARNPPAATSSGGATGIKEDAYEVIPWETLDVGKQIGTGAFAEVFEAFRAGERVAVKRFLAQSDEARREMEAEVSVMTMLHSGFVVPLYGACFTPPNMCIVMEFLPRGSLFYLLSDSTVELPWERRWSMALDAALGLNYLHSKQPPLLHKACFVVD